MSIDMSEFYQVFFEEAAELLAEMETLLVDLDIDNPDGEDLNAIFRVAHSIKGGAATFGFSDMAEVTHVLESLLDRLRKNELVLRPDMVDAFLRAGDVVKAQLAGHKGEGQVDESAALDICGTLKQLAAGEISATEPIPSLEDTAAAPPGKPSTDGPAGETFRIEFSFNGSRAVLDNLFANLREMGTLEIVNGAPASGPATIVLDPCVVRLRTDAPEDDLWEALAFQVDPTKIKIQKSADDAPTATTNAEKPAEAAKDDGFGFFEPLYQAVTAEQAAPPQPQTVTESIVAEVPQPVNHGRRSTDDPDHAATPFGRRETDKVANASGSDASSIRVNIEKVDQLINLVGELVITQAMLTQSVSKIDPVIYESLLHGIGQLERNTRDLQESVMSIRMMPIGFVFSRFPRLVRDLAAKLDKQVELKTVGEATELDKGLIEKIADPLTHLVRNSLDHGIESPAKRVAAGKPAKGTVTLCAFHQGGNIVIEVDDDGGGLHREKILAKARERGLAVHDGMADQDVWQLIFEAGFSTAEVVTDVSGRGVGMDVVKRNIKALGGSVDIQSTYGVGTRIQIRLPLTLAILDGMSVAVGAEIFIIPLTAIIESLQPAPSDIKSIGHDGVVINVRGEYLPVVALHELFNIRSMAATFDKGIMVILESDGCRKAIFVDNLLGQHQVVIKSLESNYRRVPGISGATIMGDGRVALILDVAGLIRMDQTRLLQAA